MKKLQVKRIVPALLALCLVFIGMMPALVHAAPNAEIAFGEVNGQCGEQVMVPVTISNNPGIAGFRFRVSYDAANLTYAGTQKGSVLTGGTLSAACQTEGSVVVTWFDVQNITADGVVFYLVFDVSESATGKYALSVSYLPEDIVNDTWGQVDCAVVDGSVCIGSNISGTVTAFGDPEDPVTVQLMQGDVVVASVAATDNTYRFSSVAPGSYQLVVSKDHHVTRTYDLTVAGEDLVQDVTICLLGDVNTDGRVNMKDWNRLYEHLNEVNELTGYQWQCADATADDRVNMKDWNRLYEHLNEVNPLW